MRTITQKSFTETTRSRSIIGGETRYSGEQIVLFFEDGDYITFDVNADNPTQTWGVGMTFSIYRGRAVSHDFLSLDMQFSPGDTRDAANAAMIQWLSGTRVSA